MRRALAVGVPLLAAEAVFAVGAAFPAPGLEEQVEPRFALVVGLAGLCVWMGLAAWTLLASCRRSIQLATSVGAVACVSCLALPRSVVLVTAAEVLLLTGVPALGLLGARALWRGRTVARRMAAGLLLSVLGASWVSSALALGFVALSLIPARVAHARWRPGAQPEREVKFQARDGLELRGTYTPGTKRRAVVLVHGVIDGRSRMQPLADRFATAGFHVLRIDQRAHGRSEGLVCTYGVREHGDIVRAWEWLRQQPGVSPEDGVLLGTSMGGAGVLRAAGPASRLGVSRVVALAPASDFERLAAWHLGRFGPAGRWARAGADLRLRALGLVPPWSDRSPLEVFVQDAPEARLLVLHSEADRTVPLALSESLARRLGRDVLQVVQRVEHDVLPEVAGRDEATWQAVLRFVEAP